MEKGTIFGILVGLGAIFVGNAIEGGHFGSLVQGTAALIVMGGTIGATLVSHRWQDIQIAMKYFRLSLHRPLTIAVLYMNAFFLR